MTSRSDNPRSSSRKEAHSPGVVSEEIEHAAVLRGIRKGIALRIGQAESAPKEKGGA